MKNVLSRLNIDKVYSDLDETVLLCYEDGNEFCHRHIVSAWFELILQQPVPEIIGSGESIEFINPPKYIKEKLKEVIIKNTDMKGFSNLYALYLYNKSLEMQKEAEFIQKQAYIIDSEYTKRFVKKK